MISIIEKLKAGDTSVLQEAEEPAADAAGPAPDAAAGEDLNEDGY